MSSEPTKVTLGEEECHCDLPDFYRNVAKAMGVEDLEGATYDCRRICVSEPVQEAIFAYYREEQGCDDTDIAMLWVFSGPKTALTDHGYVAEVEEGFVSVPLPF